MGLKNLTIPIGLVAFIVASLVGFGVLKGDVENTKEKVEKVETKQDKMEEYVAEQKAINTEQRVNLEYIKQMLDKIDKKVE